MAYSQAFKTPLKRRASAAGSPAASWFQVNESKLYPHFEAYKLVQEEELDAWTASYPLPSAPLSLAQLCQYQPAAGSAGSPLGYKDAKERAQHQHLAPLKTHRPADPFAAYIDRDGFIVLLTYSTETNKLVGHPIYRLSAPTPSAADEQYRTSLPSILSIDANTVVASSGSGDLVVLTLESIQQTSGPVRWIASNTQQFVVARDADGPLLPFTLKEVDSQHKRLLLVQSSKSITSRQIGSATGTMKGLGYQLDKPSRPSAAKCAVEHSSQTVFELSLIELPSSMANKDQELGPAGPAMLHTHWTITGAEPVITSRLDSLTSCHFLCAEAGYTATEAYTAAEPGPSALEERVPLATPQQPTVAGGKPHAGMPPHYSWAQTSDTVTVAFTLPSSIDKSYIRAHFSHQGLSLSLSDAALIGTASITELGGGVDEGPKEDSLLHAAKMILSGRYVSRPTWAEIDPAGSIWTWEEAIGNSGTLKGKSMRILTLHLEKKHEGTRWMQVFAHRARRIDRTQIARSRWEEVSQKTRLTFQEARDRAVRVANGDSEDVGEVDAGGLDTDKRPEDLEDPDGKDDEDDVPETLDPSELISMLEGMEKYTVDEEQLSAGGSKYGVDRAGLTTGGEGTGLSFNQPSLLKDGLEEEDATVGRRAYVSWVVERESTPELTTLATVDRPPSEADGLTSLLATPLPSSTGQEALVVKHDLDGLVLEPATDTQRRQWKHDETMPALAFVLASKRDAHRVYVHRRDEGRRAGRYAVLAFEGAPQVTGSSSRATPHADTAAGAGNLFVYYSQPPAEHGPATNRYGQSRVIRLGSGSGRDCRAQRGGMPDDHAPSGALLSVVYARLPPLFPSNAPDSAELEDTLVCLCEKRLILLQGIL